MKAHWILPVVIAVGALAFSAGRRCGGAAVADLSPLRDTSAIEKALNLTPEQAGRARELARQYADQAQTACDLHCEARCAVARKLFRENAAPDDVRKHVDAMCEAYAAQERATLDHLVKLRAILTPEQAKRLNEKLAACICDKCANASGSCCGDGK